MPHNPTTRRCLAAVMLFGAITSTTNAQISYETHALTGINALDTEQGVVFSAFGFGTPSLNDSGDTAFRAGLSGAGINSTNDRGIWLRSDGILEMVAREGDTAPGTEPNTVFGSSFLNPTITNTGSVTFGSSLTGTAVNRANDSGIWSQSGNSLDILMREGDAAAGTEQGTVFLNTFGLRVIGEGIIAFQGSLDGTDVDSTNNEGIWIRSGNTLELIARKGDAAPGIEPGIVFGTDFGTPFGDLAFNNLGEIAFRSSLAGTGVNSTNNRSIWSRSDNALELVAREGDLAPDTGANVAFDLLGDPVLNDLGIIAFHATLTGTSVDFTNDGGIWMQSNDALDLIVREGDEATGLNPGVVFSSLGGPILNNVGAIAFSGSLDGTGVNGANNGSIWLHSNDTLELVVREGDTAVGTEIGVVFSNFSNTMLNDTGSIVFTASLTGEGIDFSNDNGIWAMDEEGNLQLIVREGDLFDVDDDPLTEDLRRVVTFSFLGINSINNNDQFAFRLNFDNGTSGIFVADLSNIPEPSSLALLSLGGLSLLRRRRA